MNAKKIALTSAEGVWYVIMNIAFGAAYFAKIPTKRAMVDYGYVPELTSAERFWYVLQCIAFGAGYFAKVVASKAFSELPDLVQARQVEAGGRRMGGETFGQLPPA